MRGSSYRGHRGSLGRRDGNEQEIIRCLEEAACDVVSLIWPGDLLVGRAGVNYLLEVKDPAQPKSSRRLTDTEEEFHSRWRGQIAVVHTVEEAFEVVELTRRKA